jgi:hypothetical protein
MSKLKVEFTVEEAELVKNILIAVSAKEDMLTEESDKKVGKLIKRLYKGLQYEALIKHN